MEVFRSTYALNLLQDFMERCKSLVIDEVVHIVQTDTSEEVNKLEEKLLLARGLLDNFKWTADDGRHWQQWVGKVTGVCYEAEDLVDDITLDATKVSSVHQTVLSFFSRGSMARKIQEFRDKLELIIKGLDRVNGTNQQHSRGHYPTHFVVGKQQVLHPEEVFGRDQDKAAIITMLLEHDDNSSRSNKTISVVGMVGLGKTSLAQYVLDDPRIRDNFHTIVWVSVNDAFNLQEMTDIFSMRLKDDNDCARPGSGVLIVLDDLWEVKDNEWRLFSCQFSKFSGSKVLITTNNLKVAQVTRSVQYHLQMVKVEDCQALILNKALLSSGNIPKFRHEFLTDTAQEMAEKCKGLPAVADIVGRLLSSRCADEFNEEWKTYPHKDISELGVLEERIFPAFRLNCLYLPSQLKKCLAYCALFPYEYDFKKDSLVQLWMAEGFFLPQSSTSVEHVGYEYFQELLSRSVFQLSGGPDNQEMPSYNMHEFIHRFAESMASYTCCQLKRVGSASSVDWHNTARHLSLLCDCVTSLLLNKIEKCNGLRTLLLLSDHVTHVDRVPYSLFQRLKRLRVLDFSSSDIDELPESLGRLMHLRYLDASETCILRLPESASELHRLQVLKLSGTRLRKLPEKTKNLTNLIHLVVDMRGLRYMPPSIGSLSYLKTLSFFIVGKKEGYRITELNNLKFLSGTVCLTNLEQVKDGAEAREAMICDKASIKRLELKWRSCSRDDSIVIDILAGFQPHQYLEELQVTNYGGTSFPAWITSPSYKLVSIHIQKCRKVCVLPSLGQLPCLKTLHIEGLDLVEYVDYRFCGEGTTGAFPSLESLTISDMKGLLRWSTLPENSMSELSVLIVEKCPSISSIQSLKHMNKLQTLEINRCPALISLPELPVSIQKLIITASDTMTQNWQHEGRQWCSIKENLYVEIDGIIVNGGTS